MALKLLIYNFLIHFVGNKWRCCFTFQKFSTINKKNIVKCFFFEKNDTFATIMSKRIFACINFINLIFIDYEKDF